MYVESLAVAVRMNRPLVMKRPNVCIIVILSERMAVCVHGVSLPSPVEVTF